MGSIYGFFSQAGDASLDPVVAMSHALKHRVHDHSWIWGDQHCAMGAAFLHITPGAEREKAPNAEGSELAHVISCDSRIDNRDDLIAQFGLSNAICCDSELILSLYQLLGEACLDHLLGAFAFAIYDRQSHSIFCARDHFGEKPFSYAFLGHAFAFASEPSGVVASRLIAARPNDDRLLSLLALNPNDVASTIYRDVYRLPAAHALTISTGGLRIWRYWQPRLAASPLSGTDDEIAAQFISLLRASVFCRLRSTKPVGACLSGGLDSSTIVMLAREAVGQFSPCDYLTTFSATFPSVPGSDEEQWIEIVENADGPNLAPLKTSRHQMDLVSPLSHTSAIVAAIDEPMLAPNLFQLWELAQQAKTKGMGVLLGGHDGDTVVSHGLAMLTDLVLAEEWERFADELGMLSKFLGNYDGSRKALVGQYAVPSVKYLIKHGFPLKALRTAKILHAQYGVSLKSLLGTIAPASLKRAVRHWHLTRGRLGLVQLAKDARSATQYQRALPIASDAWSPSASEDHIRGIELPLMAETFDYFDRIGSRIGIEHRHPFFDKRLVEFCLALPLKHKVRHGWTRVIMRESTKGILPEPIRLRSDKSNLGPNLAVSLVHDAEKLTAAFSTPPPGLQRYWDMQQLRETLERYSSRPNGMDAYALLLAYSHAMWLESKANMPMFH